MKRVLVLGPDGPNEGWIERLLGKLDPKPKFLASSALLVECDGLLVVDDGSDESFDAIQKALAFREAHPHLPIAVVRSLEAGWSDNECLVRSQTSFGADAPQSRQIKTHDVQRLTSAWNSGFDVSVTNDAITFEYQG